MRLSILFIPILISLLPIAVFSQQQSSYFANPNQPWMHSGVTVNETLYEIHPKGTFTEVELFISFSASNPSMFGESELLEMTSTFELPEEVVISDLWLWFKEEILVAHIIDRWSANRIYESIVNRQQDPAILFKNSSTSYQLRVYPFLKEEVRKIKMSFLIPNNTSENTSSLQLPIMFHKLAYEISEDAIVRYWTEEDNPSFGFKELADSEFISQTDSLDRVYWESTVDAEILGSSLTIEKEEENTGVFLSTYSDSLDNYYSFSFTPESVLDLSTTKDVVIIFDLASSHISYEKQELLEFIKQEIKSNFSESDRFNFLFSNLSAQIISDTWINSTEAAVDSVFELLDSSNISGNSNLDDLLAAGFDFIQTTGTGDVLLISSSESYHSFEEANAFSDAVLNYVEGKLPKINIINIQDENIWYNYRNGRNYLGNEYLYGILTRESGGELFNYNDSQIVLDRLSTGFSILDGNLYNVDVYSTFSSGFSYGRHQNPSDSRLALNSTYTQTGKYFGDIPLTIQISGTFSDTVFNEQIVINEKADADSTLKRYWVGNKINSMETNFPSNEEVATIIDYSMDNRIMSRYTSFLALEPGDSSLVNSEEDSDDGLINDIEDDVPESFKIDSVYAYPNPFNPTVTIGVELSKPWDASNSSIIIYNMLGQVVATLSTASFNGNESFNVKWNINQSSDLISTGVYLVMVKTPYISKNIKITYLK
ncbi:MAG: T9SS type A sorting domain-containing protein [Balneolaceae bacterium]